MVPEVAPSVEYGMWPTPEDYQTIFHTSCRACEADDSWEQDLCTSCVHMRLYHLTNCLHRTPRETVPLLILGTLKELRDRRTCRFCRMVANMFNTTKLDRIRDGYFEAHILMFPCVEHLDTHHRRRILPYEKGAPDLMFFTPVGNDLDDFLQVGMERYDMVVTRNDQHNAENNLKVTGLGGAMDWSKIARWVEESLTKWQARKLGETRKAPRLPWNFRLIDVERGHLVKAPEESVYAALSYVWGGKRPDEVEATLENIAILSTKGELHKIDLPATIRDAIVFCQKFNIRYLWVDRLCIVQDDPSQKHSQIAAMDAIYSLAAFTICAAAGNDSHAGLPGVGHPRQLRRLDAHVSNIEEAPVLPGMDSSMKEESWVERGWTYQESLLGGSLFLFTEFQVFHRTLDGVMQNEDAFTDVGDANGWLTSTGVLEDSRKQIAFGYYFDYLREYSARNLSYASDTYNAFAGVFKSLYEDLDEHIYGLPEKDFDVAMVWNASPVPELTPRTRVENVVLPTWSWGFLMHWTSEVRCGRYDIVASVARWARYGGAHTLKPINATNDPTAYHVVPEIYRWEAKAGCVSQAVDPRPYVLAAWSTCIDTTVPMIQRPQLPPHDVLRKRWPTYTDFWKEAHGRNIPVETEDIWRTLDAKPSRIVVRTTANNLRIWAGEKFGLVQNYYIIDHEGWCMGICRPSIAIVKANHLPLGIGEFDFLGLSFRLSSEEGFFEMCNLKLPKTSSMNRASNEQRLPPPMSEEVPPSVRLKDIAGHDLEKPPVLFIIMVAWSGPVVHRICLGWVSLARWMRTCPRYQTVILE